MKAEFYRQRRDPQLEVTYSDSARTVLEARLREQPRDVGFHAGLALAYAGLTRKADAIREAKTSVELLPLSKDAFFGGNRAVNLAHVNALVGEPDAAIDQSELLLSVPLAAAVSDRPVTARARCPPPRCRSADRPG